MEASSAKNKNKKKLKTKQTKDSWYANAKSLKN